MLNVTKVVIHLQLVLWDPHLWGFLLFNAGDELSRVMLESIHCLWSTALCFSHGYRCQLRWHYWVKSSTWVDLSVFRKNSACISMCLLRIQISIQQKAAHSPLSLLEYSYKTCASAGMWTLSEVEQFPPNYKYIYICMCIHMYGIHLNK